jgi:hypothetical protein
MHDMQKRNVIVPLVGDFAGPKTLRAIGKMLGTSRGEIILSSPPERRAIQPSGSKQ